jgi:hypothetical protein
LPCGRFVWPSPRPIRQAEDRPSAWEAYAPRFLSAKPKFRDFGVMWPSASRGSDPKTPGRPPGSHRFSGNILTLLRPAIRQPTTPNHEPAPRTPSPRAAATERLPLARAVDVTRPLRQRGADLRAPRGQKVQIGRQDGAVHRAHRSDSRRRRSSYRRSLGAILGFARKRRPGPQHSHAPDYRGSPGK